MMHTLRLQTVPAQRGALWVRHGFKVFFSQPLAYMGLFGVFLMGMLLAQIIPWFGSLLFLASLPLLTLAFILATQQVIQGKFPGPRVFLAPFQGERSRTRALWQLGLIYAAAMFFIAWVRAMIDGGRTDALQISIAEGTATPESVAALMADARMQLSVFWFAGMALLLAIPFWHAPALVHWGGHSALKSLFFSTVACWRNKGAFLVYGITWLGAVMAFTMLSSLLFSLVGQPQWAALAMMPAVLTFSVVFYASLYFTFFDCFEVEAAPSDAAAPRA